MSLGNFVVENLPYISATSGALIGSATEALAIREAAANRQALSAVFEEAQHFVDYHESRPKRILRSVASVALFSVAGAGLGLANGMAWQPQESQETDPYLGIVVDHSGATGSHEPLSIDSINRVVTSIGEVDGLESVAQVAALGTVKRSDPVKVGSLAPGGNAPLSEAYSRVTGRIEENWTKTVGTKAYKSGVLVVTNGNLFGDPAAVTRSATELNVPVFVANVEGEAVSPQTTETLKAIAQQTNGKYWAITRANTPRMVEEITSSLEESQLIDKRPSRWPLRAISTLSTLAFFGIGYRKRSSMTLARD